MSRKTPNKISDYKLLYSHRMSDRAAGRRTYSVEWKYNAGVPEPWERVSVSEGAFDAALFWLGKIAQPGGPRLARMDPFYDSYVIHVYETVEVAA